MTTAQALKKLKSARRREAKAREERKMLTAWLIKNGVDLDGARARAIRDKRMYGLWKQGISAKEIALSVDISPERIRSVCMRKENREEKEAAKRAKKKNPLLISC